MNKYGYTREVNSGFLETIDDLFFALNEQGFGVVNKIDIQERIKDKTGKIIGDYVIIGACNPNFAYDALEIDYGLGLFFPCNIVVYKKDDKVFVSSILPSITMSVIGDERLELLAKKVENGLVKAIDSL